MILLALGCIGTNTEPRFMTVNGLAVKRIFGIPFLPDPIIVSAGGSVDIEIEVVDRERDDIELLFPHAPVGFDFPRNGTSGTFSPPEETFEYSELEIIAMDEHGATEVMYVRLVVDGATWEYDTGEPGDEPGALLFGEVDVSSGFDGEVGLYFEDDVTSCIWLWTSTTLVSKPTDCEPCDAAWAFTASGGETLEGDCSTLAAAVPELEETSIGFAAEYEYKDFPLENIVFTPIEGYGWAPLGEGTLENDRLEFYLQLLSE
ncbi:MAG TPA: hypothetical protein QGF58_02490 [Myxococcota bacterium]|nr:hypothetical protein [Myxococcota bacterium]